MTTEEHLNEIERIAGILAFHPLRAELLESLSALRATFAQITTPPGVPEWETLVRLAYADGGDGVMRIYRITAEYNRVKEQIAEMERRNVALVEAQAEEFETEKRLCDQIASLTAERDQLAAQITDMGSSIGSERVAIRVLRERIASLAAAARQLVEALGECTCAEFGKPYGKVDPTCRYHDCEREINAAKAALAGSPLVAPPPECPNCANPPHEGPCKRKVAPAPSSGDANRESAERKVREWLAARECLPEDANWHGITKADIRALAGALPNPQSPREDAQSSRGLPVGGGEREGV